MKMIFKVSFRRVELLQVIASLTQLLHYLEANFPNFLSFSFWEPVLCYESILVPKMAASRSFTFPARKCLSTVGATRPLVPTIRPIAHVCDVSMALAALEDYNHVSNFL